MTTKTNWAEHLAAFNTSSLSASEYCTNAGLKLENFRYHLSKQRPRRTRRKRAKQFHEFTVATDLVITRDMHGQLSLSGFGLEQLPQLVGAWSNALSQ